MIKLKIIRTFDNFIDAVITRRDGSTPFGAVLEAGTWNLALPDTMDFD